MYSMLLPLGAMPLWLLHRLSDLLWPVVYYVARYRVKVVRSNLERCFPTMTKKEQRRLERRYYRHLTDMVMEGLYNTAASLRRIERRYVFENAEVLEPYYRQNRSVVLMSAHYNNWEFMITSIDHRLSHHAIGVGKPLSNPRFGRWITARRARYGTEIVDHTDVREAMSYYNRWQVPVAYMMLSDQSPRNPFRSHWTQFLGQDTAFLFGAEHFARKYNMPVFLYDVKREKRGRYSIHFELLTEEPNAVGEGEITERYVRHLESLIASDPTYWLWSHRRWKLTRTGRIRKDGTIQELKNEN